MVDLTSVVSTAISIGCIAYVWMRLSRAPDDQQVKQYPQDDRPHQGTIDGCLKVLAADDLLRLVGAGKALDETYRQSRITRAAWERDLLPLLHHYAEFVQLMPASESHHHAHVGGLLIHTLETVLAATTWRSGCLLPPGAKAEALDAQKDHWTYAVFIAALLHDVGKPLTDVRVSWYVKGSTEPNTWVPLSGSLRDFSAFQYKVEFAGKADRNYEAHKKLGALLLQRIAPSSALNFLGSQPGVFAQLNQFLSGEDSVISDLIKRADRESTARSLASGSRARFPSARSVPLVELLMGAIRSMLKDGGVMPLNRDGAIGWVDGDSIWFVSKRLADSVREYVRKHAPDEPIPGDAKNDRLFDTWQEYGCAVTNPATGGAIWHTIVHGLDNGGYSHSLSMLRFPLAKLWASSEDYPKPMQGRIEVISERSPVQRDVDEPEPEERDTTQGNKQSMSVKEQVPIQKATGVLVPRQKTKQTVPKPKIQGPSKVGASKIQQAPANEGEAAQPCTSEPSVQPVKLNTSLPELPVPADEPGELAIEFIKWLQQGLKNSEISYNESTSPVHFVESGMALVSPLIFRMFAQSGVCAEGKVSEQKLAMEAQKIVLKAGWHVPSGPGMNIHQLTVRKRGNATSKLSAVILATPERWVLPVPPPNPALQLRTETTAQ